MNKLVNLCDCFPYKLVHGTITLCSSPGGVPSRLKDREGKGEREKERERGEGGERERERESVCVCVCVCECVKEKLE